MFTFTSLRWAKELQRRRQEFAGRRFAARIRVPDALAWWYYQEFGVAHPWIIAPGEKVYLAWPSDRENARNGWFWTKFPVTHYGYPPRRIVQSVLDDICNVAAEQLRTALIGGNFTKQAVRAALLYETMPKALELIVESMRQRLNPSRDPGGKLAVEHGGPVEPADVFESEAEIVEID